MQLQKSVLRVELLLCGCTAILLFGLIKDEEIAGDDAALDLALRHHVLALLRPRHDRLRLLTPYALLHAGLSAVEEIWQRNLDSGRKVRYLLGREFRDLMPGRDAGASNATAATTSIEMPPPHGASQR